MGPIALGDPYASLGDIKNYLKIPVDMTTMDAALTDALMSASADIERHCGRQFNLDTDVTARVFQPQEGWTLCYTDDFATTSGLVVEVDPGGSGTFSQTLASANYEVSPFNGVVDGQPGWPFYKIRAIGGFWFPTFAYRRRGIVQVTAQWGWPAVPAPIKQATLIIAAQKYRLADAPWGVAGMTEFGTAVRIREIPLVKETLVPYIRYPVLGG